MGYLKQECPELQRGGAEKTRVGFSKAKLAVIRTDPDTFLPPRLRASAFTRSTHISVVLGEVLRIFMV